MPIKAYPQRWRNYILLEALPSGGMADLYLAKQGGGPSYSRIIVIKKIRDGYSKDKNWLAMFHNEAQVLMSLQSPHVVQTFETYLDDPDPYLILEYVDGFSLKDIFDFFYIKNQKMNLSVTLEVLRQCAQGLAHAHNYRDASQGISRPIIHRDISPHNILLSHHGYIKIIDFGLAKSEFLDNHTATGILKGKLTYMSPEQYQGHKLDAKTDMFSLGIIAWELLTGKRLFQSNDVASNSNLERYIKNEYQIPSLAHVKEFPPEVEQLLLKLLTRNPRDRMDSSSLLGALTQIQAQYALPTGPQQLEKFIATYFKEQLNEKRLRLAKLSETTTISSQDFSHITHVSTAPKRPNYAWALPVFLSLSAGAFFYYQNNKKAQRNVAEPQVSVRPIKQISPEKILSERSQDPSMNSKKTGPSLDNTRLPASSPSMGAGGDFIKIMDFFRQFQEAIETESDPVWQAWANINKIDASKRPHERMGAFHRLSGEERSKILQSLNAFSEAFNAAKSDPEKISLIQGQEPTMKQLPSIPLKPRQRKFDN